MELLAGVTFFRGSRIRLLAISAWIIMIAWGGTVHAQSASDIDAALANPSTRTITIDNATINHNGSYTVSHGPITFQGFDSGGAPTSRLFHTGSTSIIDIQNTVSEKITFNNVHLEGGNRSASDDGGGAIRFHGGGTAQLEVNNSLFQNNGAEYRGGAIYVNGTLQGDINGTTFLGNISRQQNGGGGAVGVFGDFVGKVDGSYFANNESYNDGGAICVINTGRTGSLGGIYNSTFYQNRTTTGSGAAVRAGSIVNGIHNTKFIENHSGFWAGGVYVEGVLAGGVTDSEFTNNRSDYAGTALKIGSLEGGIHRSHFTGNIGANDAGGAIFADGLISGGITASTFTGNQGTSGGAIQAMGGFGTDAISNTEFRGNTADGSGMYSGLGGAIYLWNGEMIVHNSTFTNNTAGTAGGAIMATNSNITLRTDNAGVLLFSGNTANGAVNSIHFRNHGSLVVDTEAGSAVQMEDAFSSAVAANGNLAIAKTGGGLWNLAGTNALNADATGTVDFGVNAGTLHLYGAGDVAPAPTDAAIVMQGDASRFSVGGAGGQAYLSVGGDNRVESASIVLRDQGVILSQAKQNASLTLAAGSGTVGVEGTASVQVASGGRLGLDAMLADNGAAATVRKVGDGALDLAQQDALAGVATTAIDAGQVASSQSQAFRELLTAAGTNLDVSGDVTVESGEMRGYASADSLIKTSAGTLTLYGAADYANGSQIRQGTVVAKALGVLGTQATAIDGGARLILEHDGEFTNGVSGTGVLETRGQLYLSGDMTAHTGEVHITAGRVALGTGDGTRADSGALFLVGSGTTLLGNGRVGGLRVSNGGVVSTGHSLGRIEVAGDVAFDAGSVYEVEVNPLNQAESDLIAATGTADLGGATVRHIGFGPESAYPQEGQWVILSADGGYGATRFNEQVEHNYLFLDEFIDYPNPNDVVLRIVRNSRGFTDFEDLTPNQHATGEALDTLDSGSLQADLIGLPADTSMPGLLDSLSGEIHPTLRTALQNYDRSFGRTMLGRVFGQPTCPVPGEFPIWIEAQGHTDRIMGHHGVAQADLYGMNATIGAEKRLSGGWLLGGAFRYGHHNLRLKRRWSRGDIDSYTFGLYAGKDFGFSSGVLRWSLGASYGYHDIDTKRSVPHPNLRQTLTADYHTQTGQILTDVGYRMGYEAFTWEPFAQVTWNSAWSAAFDEKGGNGALSSRREHLGNLTHVLGLRVSSVISDRVSVIGGAGWLHVYGNRESLNRFVFQQGSDVFSIEGIRVPRDSAQLNAGVNVKLADNMALLVAYDGYLGSKTQQHAGKIQFQYTF